MLLVIETLRTRKNIATFQSALVEADGLRDKQREEIRQGREKSIRALNSTVHGVRVFDHLPYDNPARKLVDGLVAALSPQNVEPLVQDHGPAAGAERRALMSFLDRQFPVLHSWRNGPWVGVVLLFLGVAVSYAANLLSTFAI